jgi:ATP-dependent protease Clp ATPase subunit
MNLQEEIKRIKSIMGLLMENKENKPSTIILVGPQGVGKSTLSKALSKKLNIPLLTKEIGQVKKPGLKDGKLERKMNLRV